MVYSISASLYYSTISTLLDNPIFSKNEIKYVSGKYGFTMELDKSSIWSYLSPGVYLYEASSPRQWIQDAIDHQYNNIGKYLQERVSSEMDFKKIYKCRISQHLESFDSIISMAGFTLKFGNLLVQGQELPWPYYPYIPLITIQKLP